MPDILEWFRAQQEASSMTVELVGLEEGRPDWLQRTREVGGRATSELAREDGRFFRVRMSRVRSGNASWAQPFIESTSTEEYHGVILLFVLREEGADPSQDLFLVQAKAEPGHRSPGCVALTTTLQASFESMAAGTVPFADLREDVRRQGLGVLQDGGMFHQKVNWIGVLEMTPREFQERYPSLPESFYVANRDDIAEITVLGGTSEHLMQALGMGFLREGR